MPEAIRVAKTPKGVFTWCRLGQVFGRRVVFRVGEDSVHRRRVDLRVEMAATSGQVQFRDAHTDIGEAEEEGREEDVRCDRSRGGEG